jgi:L-iditol 2-dehydrogenase
MRAAYVSAPGTVAVGDFDMPVARAPGDLLVRMLRASVCGSDVHAVFHGFLKHEGRDKPGYPGHEGVGVVVESRSPTIAVGELVLTVPVVGGCFAEYQLLDDAHVVPLPPDVDLDRVLMAQQYGTTLFAMRLFWPPGREAGTVAILGAGSAGLFFVQLARAAGFRDIVVSDLVPSRLEIARTLGADAVVHCATESVGDVVRERTAGTGADLVIEAVGTDALRADAVQIVRRQGIVGFFGFPERYGDAPFPMFAAYRKSVRIQLASGTQGEPGLRAFRDAVDHVRLGEVRIDHCLRDVYPLERTPEALASARDHRGRGVKIVVDITTEEKVSSRKHPHGPTPQGL